jgi:hypothetical protein
MAAESAAVCPLIGIVAPNSSVQDRNNRNMVASSNEKRFKEALHKSAGGREGRVSEAVYATGCVLLTAAAGVTCRRLMQGFLNSPRGGCRWAAVGGPANQLNA